MKEIQDAILEAEAKRADLENKLKRVIETHEKYKGSFYWRLGSSANQRRSNESRFPGICFEAETDFGRLYEDQTYSESCKNCYYHLSVYLGGEKKGVRALKKILNSI